VTIALLLAVSIVAVALGLALRASRTRARELERRVEQSARELERVQRSFAHFAPASVVDDIVAGGAGAPEKREVTVMFADLKGFTAMSDGLDPAALVRVLNGYFAAMSRAISAHRGHVSKFMGDGIMALFGAPDPNPWQTADAVEAALAMRAALVTYNTQLRGSGLPQLAFGVGVHRGVAVAGVIGSEQLVEFTVIGDTVNVASRIETMTRTHGVDILVTGDVKRHLGDRFRLRAMPPTPVKGKPEPITTWAVEGEAPVTRGDGAPGRDPQAR
jgi:class 3 adenylate cyclase